MNDPVTIRRAETVADYLACQRAQRAAWGIDDDSYVVPVATMVGAQLHGGLVLGAFQPDGEAIGLSFAFLGRNEGNLCLYSQLTGVSPGHQDKGLGQRLKTAQRDFARSEGIPCIVWAFDPLQSGNARFNLEKLGATAGRYVVNMYGSRSDALNRDTPTDRLIAVWETGEHPIRPPTPTAEVDFPRLIDPGVTDEGGPEPAFQGLRERLPVVLIEIPAEIQRLRSERPGLARRWGVAVRESFLAAFEAGYRAVGFHRVEEGGERRCYYRLERPDSR